MCEVRNRASVKQFDRSRMCELLRLKADANTVDEKWLFVLADRGFCLASFLSKASVPSIAFLAAFLLFSCIAVL